MNEKKKIIAFQLFQKNIFCEIFRAIYVIKKLASIFGLGYLFTPLS